MREALGKLLDLNVGPLGYYNAVLLLNDLLREDFKKKLLLVPNKIKSMATFIVPGSDGRRENGSPMSKWEIITILEDPNNLELFSEYVKSSRDSMLKLGVGDIEIRAEDAPFSFYKGNPSIVQPGRFGDALSLDGNEEKLTLMKKKLGKEIKVLPNDKISKVK